MLRVLIPAGLVAGAILCVTSARGEQKQSTPAGTTVAVDAADSAPADLTADESAIRATVDAFVAAYNSGDAKAISELFAAEAIVVTQDGASLQGRDAILDAFSASFEESPGIQMEVVVDEIRFLGPDLAIELGATIEATAAGEAPEYGRYTVLHAKRDGKWLMTLARDTAGEPPTNHERLQPLAWLVGEWIDDAGSTVVHTSCRWSDDENYLLQDIRIQVSGQDEMHVSQRIGWDPLKNCVRSWTFDTEGGFSEGLWARDGDAWVIQSTGFRNDGAHASATFVIVPTGTDGYVWRVNDRVIGDEVQEPLEVKVVRKPPPPGE